MATDSQPRSRAVEDYVKAIYALQADSAAAVSTNALAGRLGVSPASVSGMLKKLAAHGLAVHAPYHGVRLTGEGESIALATIRHHRLLELYLSEHLGMAPDRVHAEAEALEHVISDELADRIAATMNNPPPTTRTAPRSHPHHKPATPSDTVCEATEVISPVMAPPTIAASTVTLARSNQSRPPSAVGAQMLVEPCCHTGWRPTHCIRTFQAVGRRA